MRRFASLDLIMDPHRICTTILAFLHLLEKLDLNEQIFDAVKAHLRANGMAMKEGTIIDAILIVSPSSTKNEQSDRLRKQTSTSEPTYIMKAFHSASAIFDY